ncbi:Maf-like protein [Thalassotalea insulae]|uniref:7-methyl-GTP pyrophosphatase n=2 Tax=Thalassotalea insulae TaxID=2056778 RepID=A0ABQ6GQ40_9GAMM|nr:Maf-like protein [Thalassotalea insulae]
MTQQAIILGSTSPFRKSLLEKLNIAFSCAKPQVDETPLVNETPQALVERLAILKAKAVANEHDNALIIGSDQVATCDGEILGKPHTAENAIKQLTKFSGKCVTFYTGLAIYSSTSSTVKSLVEPFKVHFKQLNQQDIENYVNAEQPLNCAGSFKSEGLGICLFDRLEGDDPNSLIGLPLIRLNELLQSFDFNILANQNK